MNKSLILFILLLVCTSAVNAQEQALYGSFREMVTAAKAEIEQISTDDFHKMYTQILSSGGPEFVLIDIRTEAEYTNAFIPGAFLIQRGVLESKMETDAVWEDFNHAKPRKSDTIILYCRSGSRSALAAKSLQQLGYSNVKSLEGGWNAWNEKYPNLKKVN